MPMILLTDRISVTGTERVPANTDLRRGSVLRYPQHRELPWLPSGRIIIKINIACYYSGKC